MAFLGIDQEYLHLQITRLIKFTPEIVTRKRNVLRSRGAFATNQWVGELHRMRLEGRPQMRRLAVHLEEPSTGMDNYP